MNQPLTYYGYCLRRLKALIEGKHRFINPVQWMGNKYFTIEVKDLTILVDGEETRDEGLLLKCIQEVEKKVVQKEIEYKEAG